METIFIGGSRAISRLDSLITERLDNIIVQEFNIIIGDANGADKAIQAYLSKKNYQHVVVYCSGDHPRNNLGKWSVNSVKSDIAIGVTGRNYYMIKDAKMAGDCSLGFMLWDCKSSGSLNNILNIVKTNRKCLVYLSLSKSFITFESIEKVKSFVGKFDQLLIDEFDKKINYKQRIHSKKEIEQISIDI